MDPAMRQLVEDDVVEDTSGDEEEGGIEDDDAARGAASPLRAHEAQFDGADLYAECASVDVVDEFLDRGVFCAREEGPEKSVESGAPQGRTNGDGPSSRSLERVDCRAWTRCQEKTVHLSCRGPDGERLSSLEEMAEGVDALLSLFLQHLLHHAPEQAPDVFPSLFAGEVPGEADDDGLFLEDGTRVPVPRLLNPVVDRGSSHGRVDYPHHLIRSVLLIALLCGPFPFPRVSVVFGYFQGVLSDDMSSFSPVFSHRSGVCVICRGFP